MVLHHLAPLVIVKVWHTVALSRTTEWCGAYGSTAMHGWLGASLIAGCATLTRVWRTRTYSASYHMVLNVVPSVMHGMEVYQSCNITVVMLLKNTAAKVQPMDVGLIFSCKGNIPLHEEIPPHCHWIMTSERLWLSVRNGHSLTWSFHMFAALQL